MLLTAENRFEVNFLLKDNKKMKAKDCFIARVSVMVPCNLVVFIKRSLKRR